ncbi:MAG: AraC family transcriptional regulator [Ruminococcus sp.]|nr:AraC family transcriptional regulator [Ruminococcus sp.]
MLKQIYPVIGDEKDLPFYEVGIGVECWQYPVKRPDGYEYPQIFISRIGEGEITIDGTTVKLPEGCVFYIPPHCPHSYHAVTDSWYLNWVCLGGAEVIPLLEKWNLNKFHAFPGCDSERMHRIMNRTYYTIKSDKLYGNHYASAQLYDLLIEYRKIADNRLSSFYTAHSVALADVLQFIEEHYSNQIKLNDLAKVAGVTEQHLCRLFKKNFQLRPMEYLAQVRIAHAKDLLVYSDKSIGEICEETGFQDSSYFSVVFKKYENVTPGEYRKIKV